jgi:C1A family cysteine protease
LGCSGGLKDQAFRYVINRGGLAAQKDYPYKAVDGTCKTSGFTRIGKISSYVTVTPSNPEALKAALNVQPVAVSVKADTWKSYSSGIINDASCGTATNHAVLAVGYNTEGSVPYYVVRNSWGPAWGESGHVRIGIQGGIGICGIQRSPFYPVA